MNFVIASRVHFHLQHARGHDLVEVLLNHLCLRGHHLFDLVDDHFLHLFLRHIERRSHLHFASIRSREEVHVLHFAALVVGSLVHEARADGLTVQGKRRTVRLDAGNDILFGERSIDLVDECFFRQYLGNLWQLGSQFVEHLLNGIFARALHLIEVLYVGYDAFSIGRIDGLQSFHDTLIERHDAAYEVFLVVGVHFLQANLQRVARRCGSGHGVAHLAHHVNYLSAHVHRGHGAIKLAVAFLKLRRNLHACELCAHGNCGKQERKCHHYFFHFSLLFD